MPTGPVSLGPTKLCDTVSSPLTFIIINDEQELVLQSTSAHLISWLSHFKAKFDNITIFCSVQETIPNKKRSSIFPISFV